MIGEGSVASARSYIDRMHAFTRSRRTSLPNLLCTSAIAVAALALPSAAQAVECWEVTGWTTTPMPGTQSPGTWYERAVLTPTGCSTTPQERLWVQVDQAVGGASAPSDLWVLVDRFDTLRTDASSPSYPSGTAHNLYGGLVYQGAVFGVIPDVWRPVMGGADVRLERHSPVSAPPTDGAVVVLEQFEDADCLYLVPNGTGPLELHWSDCSAVAPFVDLDHLSTGSPGWDPGNWWPTGIAFELYYEGTNTAGEDEWSIVDAGLGVCLSESPWTTNVSVGTCTGIPEQTWVFEAPVVPGNVQVRNVANGLCLGPVAGGPYPTFTTCGSSAADWRMTSLELGTAPPSDDGPGEDGEVTPGLPPEPYG